MKRRKTVSSIFLLFVFGALLFPPAARGEDAPLDQSQSGQSAPEEFKRFEVVFEPNAYYTDLDVIIALTKAPIPNLGELTELDIYQTLLSRAALLPRFLVLEGSVNPMPNLGVYIRDHDPGFYSNAQISGSFNWVKALTAGFEEPWAVSFLAGNVADFFVADSRDTKGLGYSGYLFSAGNYHIKDNQLIKDQWREYEWKMKGDRKSPVKKLSWSFRIGVKTHGNPYITDIVYLGFRRSRVDYKTAVSSVFNNSGFEYTYDMDRRTLSPIRHYFFVDKKWPFANSQTAFSLAVGFVWESARKYTGPLAVGRDRNDFQFLLRPNIEF